MTSAAQSSADPSKGPLSGYVVLDFSTLLPGPLAGLIFAEAGAEVIKIEKPGGEGMRDAPGEFAMLNRGKRSIEIDLKAAGAFERLRPLIQRADVVLEQFRPGVMKRLGFGYEALAAVNPRLVYCSINGYGSTGPHAMRAGHDMNYLAETGIMRQTAGSDGAPVMPMAPLADLGGGTVPAVINVLLALLQRERTGRGCEIEIAMFDHIFAFMYPAFACRFGNGRWPQPGNARDTGAAPSYSIYRTRDGRYLTLGASEPKFWEAFCEAVSLPPALRHRDRDPEATRAGIAGIIATRDGAEWMRHFQAYDFPAALVLSFEEALSQPHFLARNLLKRRVSADGKEITALPVPLAANLRTADLVRTSPTLGEGNALLDAAERK